MSKYEVGQRIVIEDFSDIDDIINSGCKAGWVSIGEVEITSVPKEGDKNDRH